VRRCCVELLTIGLLVLLHKCHTTAKHMRSLLCITTLATAVLLLQNAWPEMLQTLLNNVTGQFPEGTKCASLEALGYMCDDVSSSCQ
jgi:hypothetical protein